MLAGVALAARGLGEDAAEFMIAGASLVEVGTATFWSPSAPLRIAIELKRLLPDLGVRRACELVGTFRVPA